MRLLLVILVLLFFSRAASAQEKLVYDSSLLQVRSFSDSSLQVYKNDRNFQYERQVIEKPSLWDRFWRWFWNLYDEIMSTKTGQVTIKIIYWILGLGAIAFFVYKIMRMNRLSLFTSSETATAYKIESENIHAIPFDAAINEALQNGNYRLAVRLLYLQSLKTLADKEVINWQSNKTNTDYWREISNPSLQYSFKLITGIFEYGWYGSHAVTKEDFSEMKEEILKFQNQV